MLDERYEINRNQSILIVLMLLILTIVIYWPTQNYEFIHYDDSIYIIKNNNIHAGITLEGLYWAFSAKYFDLWTPLVYISFMLDYQLFGVQAGGYHWTNVTLHIFNTILLFFLFKNLTGALWRSAFVAALFAVHPMNVESVAWIAERKNVLSTFFWMLTMLFYVWYIKQPNWKRYLPMFISFALGLMSKPMLVPLPFVLLLMDYWPLDRMFIGTRNNNIGRPIALKKEKTSFLVLEKVPLVTLSVAAVLINIYSPRSNPEPQVLIQTDFMQRISTAIFSYVMYIKKLFWPTDLSILYMDYNIPVWSIFFCAVFLIIMTFFVSRYFKRYPYLFVGWFWYVGTLMPVSGIVPIGDHTMADRYAYVTFIGLFVMMAWGSKHFFSKTVFLKKLSIVASVLIILFFTIAAYHRVNVWANTTTLFEDALKKNPNNFFACQILGSEMAKKGQHEKALQYYDRALKANSKLWPAYNNKGLILNTLGRREEALQNFQKAIKANKFSVEAYHNIGAYYYENKNFDEAVKYFLRATEIDPLYIESYNYLGVVLVEQGKIDDGVKYFNKVLQMDPRNMNAQKNLKIAQKLIENLNKK